MKFSDLLGAASIPILLCLYAILWLAIQPVLIKLLKASTQLVSPSSSLVIVIQVLTTLLYLVINALWLLSWYRLSKNIRNSLIKNKGNK